MHNIVLNERFIVDGVNGTYASRKLIVPAGQALFQETVPVGNLALSGINSTVYFQDLYFCCAETIEEIENLIKKTI